ncbi:ATP-dependent Clp protease proteolytic subunit [Pseudonocardia kunmingensis]|uniref:ATP-dependent Clp protease proteolytic subunit n=1 Tax=Pseudonocardia kunmingensis TaxID=630975 RepID=A0A543CYU6_9PSEU|nr:ATP-dependent Clp protease proteolytic subunit [Pseudonocardia kunmingensis]TQM02276.1 ATP-dependent Clp protease proteolytic subunit ClpP [Pseudonocardia kunmingensis]
MPTTEVRARSVLPSFVERTSYGHQETNPYSKLFEGRIVFLGAPIDDVVANDVMAQLICLESSEPDREISMYINSPGGSLTAMTAIYDTMRYIRPAVHTYCLGQAASAAAVLLAAGAPGRRSVVPNARVLIHQPSVDVIRGQTSDLEIHAAEVTRLRRQLEAALAEATGRPAERVRDDIERDLILTADEAVAYGLADHVVSSRKPAR